MLSSTFVIRLISVLFHVGYMFMYVLCPLLFFLCISCHLVVCLIRFLVTAFYVCLIPSECYLYIVHFLHEYFVLFMPCWIVMCIAAFT